MRNWLSLALGFGLVLVGGVLAASRPQVGATDQLILGPSQMVPFASVLTRTTAGVVQTGRFFRDANGSQRHEVGPAVDTVTMVEIKNVPEVTYYLWDARLGPGWIAHPMQLRADGRVSIIPAMKKSAFVPNSQPGPVTYEGIEVLLRVRGGLTSRIAPSLNFLHVDTEMPDGTRMLHSNIHVGPIDSFVASLPAPTAGPGRDPLFDPPYNVNITWKNDPEGIISKDGPPPR